MNRTAKRSVLWGGGAVGLALVIVFLLVRTRPESGRRIEREEGLLVETQIVHPQAAVQRVRGFGTVRARTQLTLVAQTGGEVEYLAPELRDGGEVSSGVLLVRLDRRSHELAAESARLQAALAENDLAALEQERKNTEAELELMRSATQAARRGYDRALEMVRARSGSESARDNAETAWLSARSAQQTRENSLALWPTRYQTAREKRLLAQVQRAQAELNLGYTEIRAPFPARVLSREVEVGQYVAPGTRLAFLYENSAMEIPVRLPLEEMAWIPLQGPDGTAPAAIVRLRDGGATGAWTWNGRVVRRDAQIDRATRTGGVVVEVLDRTGRSSANGAGLALTPPPFVPGLFVEAEIEGIELPRVTVLSRGLIDQDNRVYLAKNGRLHLRPVQVLRTDGDTAYIGAGLEGGEQVIISPIAAPVEGARLQDTATSETLARP